MNLDIAKVLKCPHYPLDVTLTSVRWCVAYPLSQHDVDVERETPTTIRQFKYLSNIAKQDHRAIKCLTRPMFGFKDFCCVRILLGAIELMNMIAKGRMRCPEGSSPSAAHQIFSLAA